MAHARRHARAVQFSNATAAQTAKSFRALDGVTPARTLRPGTAEGSSACRGARRIRRCPLSGAPSRRRTPPSRRNGPTPCIAACSSRGCQRPPPAFTAARPPASPPSSSSACRTEARRTGRPRPARRRAPSTARCSLASLRCVLRERALSVLRAWRLLLFVLCGGRERRDGRAASGRAAQPRVWACACKRWGRRRSAWFLLGFGVCASALRCAAEVAFGFGICGGRLRRGGAVSRRQSHGFDGVRMAVAVARPACLVLRLTSTSAPGRGRTSLRALLFGADSPVGRGDRRGAHACSAPR